MMTQNTKKASALQQAHLLERHHNRVKTKENKQDVDRVIHSIVGVEYKNCSATWKEVKKRIAEDEENFETTKNRVDGKITSHCSYWRVNDTRSIG